MHGWFGVCPAANMPTVSSRTKPNTFSTRASRKIVEGYKKATGKVLDERQLLKHQDVTNRQKLRELYELVHGSDENYVDALKLALKIHDEVPVLPTTIAYLALYLSIHHPEEFEDNFADMDEPASFIELGVLEDPMRSALYFMRCLVNEDPLEVRKQLESGLKLEPADAAWIWPAWRFGALLSMQAHDWNSVVSWASKAIQVLKKNNAAAIRDAAAQGQSFSPGHGDDESVARSINSASSQAAASSVEHYFTAPLVVRTLFEQPPQPGNINHQLAELFFYRASALQELGLNEEARDNFDMVLELDSAFGEPYNDAALQSEENNHWQVALDNYNILLKLEPNNFGYLLRAATTTVHHLNQLENSEAAAENDEELTRIANQALTLFSEALEVLQQDPRVAEAVETTEDYVYVSRGAVFERIDEPRKAMADYTTAIQLNQSNRDALRHRAALFEKRGEIKEAVKDYEKLVSSFDESKDLCLQNAPIYRFLAQQRFIQGDRRGAAKLYTQAFRCGSVQAEDVAQAYEVALCCGVDFLARLKEEAQEAPEGSTPAAQQSASLTHLCLLKLDEPYAPHFGPFSNPVHDFRKNMSDSFFADWKQAAEAAKDPKKKGKGKK